MKNFIYICLLGIIVALSACTSQTTSNNNVAVEPTEIATAAPTTVSFAGTLEDLKNQGTAQCTYSYTSENFKTQGKVYVDKGNMRNDMTNTVDGVTTQNHLILNNQLMSMWETGQKTGIQMDYTKAKQMAEDAQAKYGNNIPQQNVPDLTQKYDYKCTSWKVDPTVFVPPADVTFTDLTKQMEQLQSVQQKLPAGAPNGACGACEQLKGEEKVQCLQVVKC